MNNPKLYPAIQFGSLKNKSKMNWAIPRAVFFIIYSKEYESIQLPIKIVIDI